jgi:hypothetical protein
VPDDRILPVRDEPHFASEEDEILQGIENPVLFDVP